jgi:hypothetical protein
MVNITNIAASIVSGVLGTAQIPGLDATKITSGTFAQSMITNLVSDLGLKLPTTTYNTLLNQLYGGTSVLSAILAGNVPSLDASKITTGQFPQAMVNITSIAASIVTGVLGTSQIPALDASKITSGQFAQSMVNITAIASSIITGTFTPDKIVGTVGVPAFVAGLIPSLDASKITTGQFAQSMVNITSIAAGIITGTLATGNIPSLDATKITSGTFTTSLIPNITKAMSTDLQATIDNIYQAMFGGTSTGNTVASVKTGLLAIPGPNIATAIAAGIVPSLDASKITTGQFLTALIPNLAASIITSGVFSTGQIPALDATKITTGTFLTSLIPNLNASIINAGTFLSSLIPSLDATKITSGIFGTSLIPNLDAGKIVSGVLNALQIPSLDASKIGSGSFANSMVPNLNAAFNASNSSNSNIATDGDFENSVVGSAVWSTEQKYTGTHSAKLVSTATIWASGTFVYLVHSDTSNISLSVTPGSKYYVECYIYGHASNTQTVDSGGYGFQIAIDFLDVSGSYLSSGGVSQATTTALKGKWSKLSSYITVPANAVSGNAYARLTNMCTAGEIYYVDAVLIREVTEPQNIVNQIFGSLGLPSSFSAILPGVVPGLDASKITTGNFAQSMVTNLPTDLSNRLLTNIFNQSAIAGTNLVISPDFEDTTIYRDNGAWDGVNAINVYGNVIYSTDQAHGGTHSLKMPLTYGDTWVFMMPHTKPTGGYGETDPTSAIRVQGGQKFYFEAWVYPHASNTVGVGSGDVAHIAFDVHDSTGVNAAQQLPINPTSLPPKGAWTKISGYITIPAGYDLAWPFIEAYTSDLNPSSNIYYWDNAVIREETEPQNIIQQIFGSIGLPSSFPNLLPGVIPGLDTSKITSGSFANTMVPGLNSAFLAKTAAGSNIVVDPGVENTAIWATALAGMTSASVSTTRAYGGSQSIRLVGGNAYFSPLINGSGSTDWTSYKIKVKAGQQYKLAMKAWRESANSAAGNFYGGSMMVATDGSATYPGIAFNTAQSSIPAGAWTDISGYFTVPANITDIAIYVQLVSVGSTDVFYVDQVSLTEETQTQSIINQLFGGVNVLSKIIPGTIPDVTKTMSADMQTIIDNINQSVTGSPSTGTSLDSIIDNLTAFPQENIVVLPDPLANVLFDSAGAGNYSEVDFDNGGSHSATQTSWSHTIATDANYVVVPIVWSVNASRALSGLTRTVNVGGKDGSSLGVIDIGGSQSCWLEFFGVRNPPTGAQTVTAKVVTNGVTFTQTFYGIAGGSESYKGVKSATLLAASLLTGSTNNGHTYTSASGRRIARAIGAFGNVTWSSESPAAKYKVNRTQFSLQTTEQAGAASTVFAATGSSTSNYIADMAIELVPNPSTVLGSGMLQARTSTTASAVLATGNNPLAGSWFDTPFGITPDLTWTTSTNTVKVGRAGWYLVEVNLLGNQSTNSAGLWARAILYQNGAVTATQGVPTLIQSGIGFLGVSGTFIVYCSAGDTLAPGIYCSGTATAAKIVGEATGSQCYFKIALMNRSLA